ncbi:hypothetical protein Lal_00049365 [Lupinus albus]|nr:hypothetical protein Lal_00049365 [Lupinus albus]
MQGHGWCEMKGPGELWRDVAVEKAEMVLSLSSSTQWLGMDSLFIFSGERRKPHNVTQKLGIRNQYLLMQTYNALLIPIGVM